MPFLGGGGGAMLRVQARAIFPTRFLLSSNLFLFSFKGRLTSSGVKSGALD